MARRRSSKRGRRKSRGSRWWFLGLVVAIAALLYFPRGELRGYWSERQGLSRVEGHAALIVAAARETGLDANLLAGVMMVESRGHVDAKSPAGALGLFQLIHSTAKERARLLELPPPSRQDLLSDAALNTRLGAHYLAWLMRRYQGEEERVLIAYNAGLGRLERWIEEAGSYAAWRDARERAGNSGVLAYARNVQNYRQRFADRGTIVPTAAAADPTSSATPAAQGALPGFVGPPAPTAQQ